MTSDERRHQGSDTSKAVKGKGDQGGGVTAKKKGPKAPSQEFPDLQGDVRPSATRQAWDTDFFVFNDPSNDPSVSGSGGVRFFAMR